MENSEADTNLESGDRKDSSEEENKIEDVIVKYQLPKKAPRINWGGDFDSMPQDEKVAYLKKFADSFNHALDLMQKERNEWIEKARSMETQFLNCQTQLQTQMSFVQETVRKENEVKHAYQNKINALEEKLRKLS